LPGSEDHQTLWRRGVALESDLNRYDLEHVCAPHPRMSQEEWQAIYREAWSLYYTPAHMETLLRRAVATQAPVNSLIKMLVNFATTVRLENVHPLQGGILRQRHPSERRPGLPSEGAFFWPRIVAETIWKHAVIIGLAARLIALKIAIGRDPMAQDHGFSCGGRPSAPRRADYGAQRRRALTRTLCPGRRACRLSAYCGWRP